MLGATAPDLRTYRFGPFRLESPNGLLLLNDRPVSIPPRVLAVLEALVEKEGELVTKEALIDKVWGGAFIEESNITKCIAELRRILRPGFGKIDPILTVWKRGYHFKVPVEIELRATSSPASVDLRVSSDPEPDPVPRPVPPRRSLHWVAVVLTAGIATLAYFGLQVRPSAGQRPKVAVLSIRNISNDRSADWLGTALAETLTSELQAGAGLVAISADRVSSMRAELRLRPDAVYDAAVLQKVRGNLGCRLAVTGTVLPLGNGLRLDLHIQDTGTGETRGSFSTTGSADNLFDLVSRAGNDLRRALGQTAQPAATPPPAVSAESLRLYAQGIDRLRAGDAPAAQQFFTQALAGAKGYAPLHANLSLAWSLMGFDARARDEARQAIETDSGLPREQELSIEARYAEVSADWPKAAETWRALWKFYPDQLDYVDRLAAALTTSGKSPQAAALLHALPSTDPRVLIAEARASMVLSDYRSAIAAATDAVAQSRRLSTGFLESRALTARGTAFRGLSEFAKARADFHDAGQISASLGDRSGVAAALLNEASIVRIESLKNATLLVEQSLRIDTEIGNRTATIEALTSLSSLHRATADMSGAIKFAEQALVSARETANATDEAQILTDLGNLLNNTGNPEAGRKRYQEGLARSREIGYRSGIERATTNLAIIAYFTGDLAGAMSGFQESLRLKRESGNRDSIAYTLTFLGRVAVSAGDLTAARRYFEESAQIYRSIGETPTGPTIFITPVEIAEGHSERVEAALMPLTAKYNRPAPGGQIWMALAESWLARGNLVKAREARASAFALRDLQHDSTRAGFGLIANAANHLAKGSVLAAR